MTNQSVGVSCLHQQQLRRSMFITSERAPTERERPLLEQWVARLAPSTGGLPGAGRRADLTGPQDRRRYDRAKAWLLAPRVNVTHVEAARVALVCLDAIAVHVFDVGDDRLFALDCEWYATDGAAWPNSVFEIWYPVGAYDVFGDTELFCYGTALPIEREYGRVEVDQHGRRVKSGYPRSEAKEGVFPGTFENVLDAYARHVDSNPARRGW